MELDVKVKKVKDGGNLLGLATVNFGNTIEVNSITVSINKTMIRENRLYIISL